MTYKILSAKTIGETLITEVEFNVDSAKIQVSIPHYMPSSLEEIESNIINASQSEIAKYQALQSLGTIASEITLNVEKPL
jgi:hypothetical protein